MYEFDVKTSQQSFKWSLKYQLKRKKTHLKIAQMLRLYWQFPLMLEVYWVHVPLGQKVNKEYYLSVLKHLSDVVHCMLYAWLNNSWTLYDDSALLYRARIVLDYLTKYHVNTLNNHRIFHIWHSVTFYPSKNSNYIFTKIWEFGSDKRVDWATQCRRSWKPYILKPTENAWMSG